MSRRSFIGGTVILMAAGFIVRIFGFVYRIFLSNLIGAEGMGLFSLISPVYSLVILTLTSGISIAVSKMVAAEYARNNKADLARITACAVLLVVALGGATSAVMYLNLDFIVHSVLKDSRTYYSMLIMIFCIPIIAVESAIKGYFYGIQDVVPTAISQIVEQMVKIGLVMALAAKFVDSGLEVACAVATFGMAAGEMANMCILWISYSFKNRKSPKKGSVSKGTGGRMRKRQILKEITKISVPVSFNRFVSSIMSAAEQILIPGSLLAGGLNYQRSMEEFGRLSGMAMPLLYFPCLVTSSLATTLVPAISEAVSLKRYRLVNYRISKSIQMTFVLGFLFTAIFYSYAHDISDLIYARQNVGEILFWLSFTCVFTYLQQTMLGTLNGLGKQTISLANSMVGNIIRIGFVCLAIPKYGIKGYVWGIITSAAIVCVLNLSTVIKTTGMALDIRNWIIKPGGVCLFMILTSKYIHSFFTIFNLGTKGTVMTTVGGSFFIGLSLMMVTGALDKDEITGLVKTNKKK